jgi:protein arginine kinase
MILPAAEMLDARGKWFAGTGSMADAILSTRVRLARNVRGLRFPPRALPEELNGVLHRVESAVTHIPELRGGQVLAMDRLSALEREFLLERHLASHDLASDGAHRGLCHSPDEGLAILVNEEDHLRLQALRPGFQLDACFTAANGLDDALEAHIEYAFSDDFGFLTACPTNVGTGLRASVLIHLPALVLTRRIKKVLSWVTQVGLTVRGFYGEGTDVVGNFFQISNQITLGEKESQTLLNLERVVHQLLEHENKAREVLLKDAGDQIEDKVRRALGTLMSAHLLTAEETIGLTSAVRLGVTMHLSGLPDIGTLNAILLCAQPAHLQLRAGHEMDAQERHRLRARTMREMLAAALAA